MGTKPFGVILVCMVLLWGCAPAPAPTRESGDTIAQPRTGAKRIVLAVLGDHPTVISKFERTLPGAEAIEFMVAASLTIPGPDGEHFPVLAEAVPTTDNGLWKVFPDGTMETTWTLKPNLVWHDGHPVTTEDLLFRERVAADPEMVNFKHAGQELVTGVRAVDNRTITVRWSSPYIRANSYYANALNGTLVLFPLPKHILERPFMEDKARFTELPFWSDEFVGTGAFKVRSFERGSRLVLDAFDQYALGAPKVDTLEIQFTTGEISTVVARLLAGTVDVTVGRGVEFEIGLETAERWPDGRFENVAMKSFFALYPQFTPEFADPQVLLNVRFRKALMHALDRQTMADVLQRGSVPVAHSMMSINDAAYKDVEPMFVKYDYDQRRATQMIQELGYTLGPEGRFRDAAGQELRVEVRATPGEIYDAAILTIADYFQRAGVTTPTLVIPRQRQTDLEWRSKRGGFEFTRRGTELPRLSDWHTRFISGPETNWVGRNIPRYSNSQFDAMLDRYFATIPDRERNQVLGEIMRHMTDQLVLMTIFYDGEPALLNNRLVNVGARPHGESTQAWNVHMWDVK